MSSTPDDPQQTDASEATSLPLSETMHLWDIYFARYHERKRKQPTYSLKAYAQETGVDYGTARRKHGAYKK